MSTSFLNGEIRFLLCSPVCLSVCPPSHFVFVYIILQTISHRSFQFEMTSNILKWKFSIVSGVSGSNVKVIGVNDKKNIVSAEYLINHCHTNSNWFKVKVTVASYYILQIIQIIIQIVIYSWICSQKIDVVSVYFIVFYL